MHRAGGQNKPTGSLRAHVLTQAGGQSRPAHTHTLSKPVMRKAILVKSFQGVLYVPLFFLFFFLHSQELCAGCWEKTFLLETAQAAAEPSFNRDSINNLSSFDTKLATPEGYELTPLISIREQHM